MIEYQGYGRLSRKSPTTLDASNTFKEKQALTPGYSINPIISLIIFLLGRILGGHQQASMQSSMMHQWVSLARYVRALSLPIYRLDTFSQEHQLHDVSRIYYYTWRRLPPRRPLGPPQNPSPRSV